MGDLLVSGGEGPKDLLIPTVGPRSNVFPKGSAFVPVALRQKVNVLAPNLAIGWCGSVIAAKSIIKGLKSEAEKKPLSREDLKAYLDNVDDRTWELGVQLTGFLIDSCGPARFWRNCSEVKTNDFGMIVALGSGADYASKYFQNFSSNKILGVSAGMNVLDRAISVGASAAGAFLCHEMATHRTIGNYFGAGYEIISQFGREFKKLDEITYIFWLARVTNDGVDATLKMLAKYAYNGEMLIIRAITVADSGPTIESDFTYHVPPIYTEVGSYDYRTSIQPDMDSVCVCNVFEFPANGKYTAPLVHVLNHKDKSTKPLILKIEDRRFIIGLKKDYWDPIIINAVKNQ